MNAMWVCEDCRSVNSGKDRRCYKCQVQRPKVDAPATTAATAAPQAASRPEVVQVLAKATRAGARYRPTWAPALLVVLLILLATALDAVQVVVGQSLVAPDHLVISSAELDNLIVITLAAFGLYFVAVVMWSIWIAVVVSNVPALTARWPSDSPPGAFFAAFIPIIGLKRPHTVIRSVLSILGEGRAWLRMLALAWWLAVLATWLVPAVILYAARVSPDGQAMAILASEVRLALLVPAALLAIAVVATVEREQRGAVRRRASVMETDVQPLGRAIPVRV